MTWTKRTKVTTAGPGLLAGLGFLIEGFLNATRDWNKRTKVSDS